MTVAVPNNCAEDRDYYQILHAALLPTIRMANPASCRKKGFFATSQCRIKKTKDTGAMKRQPSPHNRLVLNAAIKVPIPPMTNTIIPIICQYRHLTPPVHKCFDIARLCDRHIHSRYHNAHPCGKTVRSWMLSKRVQVANSCWAGLQSFACF